MKPPFAQELPSDEPASGAGTQQRRPRAFVPSEARDLPAEIEVLSDTARIDETMEPPPRRRNWMMRIAWGAGGLLVSLALGLAADQLIRDLFARAPWLGWVGVAVLALFVVAIIAIIAREAGSVMRLGTLEKLRQSALKTLESDRPAEGKAIVRELAQLYAGRADMARARAELDTSEAQVFDGAEHVRLAERLLMTQLDARARALTAASARRVALVTTVSPRALIDLAFVLFESVRLGGAIARLYGARPGIVGTFKLLGAILTHLAVTGGLVLTDGVMEQLVGQGLAAKISARLGEGVVNGLMTVRVGIAAMRVVRPLPYAVQKPPMVKDFIPELANVLKEKAPPA